MTHMSIINSIRNMPASTICWAANNTFITVFVCVCVFVRVCVCVRARKRHYLDSFIKDQPFATHTLLDYFPAVLKPHTEY